MRNKNLMYNNVIGYDIWFRGSDLEEIEYPLIMCNTISPKRDMDFRLEIQSSGYIE